MVKLFSDEEMLEMCKLYQPIPLDLEQKILHYEGDSRNITILNGVIPSPYKIGQPVDSIINYAHQLEYHLPVSAEKFIQAYEDILEKEMEDSKKIKDELFQQIMTNVDMQDFEDYEDFEDFEGYYDERRGDTDSSRIERTRRTKQQMSEARQMGKEDIRNAEKRENKLMGEEDIDKQ